MDTIIQGMRGPEFVEFIRKILRLGMIKEKNIDKIVDERAIQLYSKAFTSKKADPDNNYEVFEFLGDLSYNKALMWYFSRRFPGIYQDEEAVKILSRLKIEYVSKTILTHISEELGAGPFITATMDQFKQDSEKRITLFEDIFESMIGVTEMFIDSKYGEGVGYSVIYNVVKSIWDKEDISITYEMLFDAKTRLKETFDYFKGIVGKDHDKFYSDYKKNVEFYVTITVGGGTLGKKTIGRGHNVLKKEAEKLAAEQGINTLKELGYYKPPPDYSKLSRS